MEELHSIYWQFENKAFEICLIGSISNNRYHFRLGCFCTLKFGVKSKMSSSRSSSSSSHDPSSHGSPSPSYSHSFAMTPSTPVASSSSPYQVSFSPVTYTPSGEKEGLHVTDATPGTIRFLVEVGMTSAQGQAGPLIRQLTASDVSHSSPSTSVPLQKLPPPRLTPRPTQSEAPSTPLYTRREEPIDDEDNDGEKQEEMHFHHADYPLPIDPPATQKLRQLLRILTEETIELNEELRTSDETSSLSSPVPHILIGFFLALLSLILGHLFFNMFDYFAYGYDRNVLLGDIAMRIPTSSVI